MRLLDWCTANVVRSSCLFRGDLWRRHACFHDDPSLPALKQLRADELYGWSKHLFDMAVAERAARREECRRNGPA